MKQRGFTLIEMMIVIAILGILGSLIAPVIVNQGISFMEFAVPLFLMFIAVSAIIWISYAYRVKQMRNAEQDRRKLQEIDRQARAARAMERERQDNAAREKLRQHPNYGNARFNPMNPDVLNPVYKASPASQTQIVGRNSVGIQSRGNVVYTDDSNELLTAMILNQAMNSRSDATAGTVQWDDDTPAITPKSSWDREESYNTPEPERKSSYSSSYSSSSSDDDSSSRSSYSSSYSSSSSDSSYSSSSSDSSSSSSWD